MTLSWEEASIGNRVRVRSVADMIAEFGEDGDGSPSVDAGWNHTMALGCGLTCRVVERERRIGGYLAGIRMVVHPEDVDALVWDEPDQRNIRVSSIFLDFNWSAQMFEPIPVVVVAVEDPSVSALLQLLGTPPAGALTIHPRSQT